MSVVNLLSITKSVADILAESPDFSSLLSHRSKQIRVNPYINVDPNNAEPGWCGVYNRRMAGVPSSIPGSFSTDLRFTVVVQAVDISDIGCSTKLDSLINTALEAILRDLKLRTTVDFVKSFDVEYTYLETDRESLYFQMANINLLAVGRSN